MQFYYFHTSILQWNYFNKKESDKNQLHCHVIPRKEGDVVPNDNIYQMINKFDAEYFIYIVMIKL